MESEPKRGSQLAARLDVLRESNPQSYGYLRNNWKAVKQGLDNTTRSYAQARCIHGNIPEPDLTTRALGNTLRVLEDLEVLDTRSERNNANLYDVESYNPEKLDAVGRLLRD